MSQLRDALNLKATEKEFQQSVIDIARAERWAVYHTFNSKKSAPGFPDLVLVRGTRLAFLELKSERGPIRPEQQKWIDALARVKTVNAHIVRPSQMDQIIDALKARP